MRPCRTPGQSGNPGEGRANSFGSDPLVSVGGMVPVTGATRHYQVWYRNAAPFCTPSTFNLTNGLEIAWTP